MPWVVTTPAAISASIAAAIRAAYPRAADRTFDPRPPDVADLPTFAVEVEPGRSEVASMASAEALVDGVATVRFRVRLATPGDAGSLRTLGDAVFAIVRDDAATQSLVGSIEAAGSQITPAAEGDRVAEIEVGFDLKWLEAAPASDPSIAARFGLA